MAGRDEAPGRLVTVDCDVLTAPDSDLRLVIYTARPGSDDAGKLDLLRVAGLQALPAPGGLG